MKSRAIVFLLALTLVVCLPSTALANIDIRIDGKEYIFDPPPIIKDGRTLAPMRSFFEALGATVDWDAETQTAIGKRGDITVRIPIGSTSPTVNERVETIQVPAQIINSRTYIPLRFVGEALGDDVQWDDTARSITITSSKETVGHKISKEDFTLSIDTLPYRGAVLFIDFNETEELPNYALTVDIGQNGTTMQEKMPVEEIDDRLVAEIIDLMYVIGSNLDFVLKINDGNGETYVYEYSLPFEQYGPWKDWMFDLKERVIIDHPWNQFKYDYPDCSNQLGAHASWDFYDGGKRLNVFSGTVGFAYKVTECERTGGCICIYNPYVGAIVQYGHMENNAEIFPGKYIEPGDYIGNVIRPWDHIHYTVYRPFEYIRNPRMATLSAEAYDKWHDYYMPVCRNRAGEYINAYYNDPFYYHEPTTLGYWYEDTLPQGMHDKMVEIFKRENPGVVLPATRPLVEK